MRIILIDSCTSLVVLQEMSMPDYMKTDGQEYVDLICKVSGTEQIVLYRQDRGYFPEQFWYIENVDLEIERSDLNPGNDWRNVNRQRSHNKYFRQIKSIMISYIREKKIDKVLKIDDGFGEYC